MTAEPVLAAPGLAARALLALIRVYQCFSRGCTGFMPVHSILFHSRPNRFDDGHVAEALCSSAPVESHPFGAYGLDPVPDLASLIAPETSWKNAFYLQWSVICRATDTSDVPTAKAGEQAVQKETAPNAPTLRRHSARQTCGKSLEAAALPGTSAAAAPVVADAAERASSSKNDLSCRFHDSRRCTQEWRLKNIRTQPISAERIPHDASGGPRAFHALGRRARFSDAGQ